MNLWLTVGVGFLLGNLLILAFFYGAGAATRASRRERR